MTPGATTIIVGVHGYVVLVEDDSEWARVIVDGRDIDGHQVRYEDAGGREKAALAAVAMALRLNDTRTEELRAALNHAEGLDT